MMYQLLTSVSLLLSALHGIHPLKICSFNVRTFGKSKAAKEGILDVLVKIISRCDLLLMMEIKDVNNQAFPTLMGRLNKHKLLSVKRSYQYPDFPSNNEDAFAREPFVAWFSSPYTSVKDFVVIPLHSVPRSSAREIDALYDVYTAMRRRWRAKYFIIMGDLNADCDYVRRKEWKNIRLRNDTNFAWLIGDGEDTTVKESTHCAYDRIVLRGEKLLKAVVPDSVSVFNFKEVYGMTERQALNVSDHYPVEVNLRQSYGFHAWRRSLKGRRG
ncbi:deoxyribonuclease gamma-like isoform X2 [Rhinoraja longicauda]